MSSLVKYSQTLLNRGFFITFNIMILVVIIGVMSAFLTLFLNYTIGKPGSKEFSVYEIFSAYTLWLAKRRLEQIGLYKQYNDQYQENLERTNSKHEIISLKNDYKKIIYNAAEPYFTWERAVGMCPICFNFWVSCACATFVGINVVNLVSIILISHVVIRILNKFL